MAIVPTVLHIMVIDTEDGITDILTVRVASLAVTSVTGEDKQERDANIVTVTFLKNDMGEVSGPCRKQVMVLSRITLSLFPKNLNSLRSRVRIFLTRCVIATALTRLRILTSKRCLS